MDRKLNFKIGWIVTIAVVFGIVGTLAITSFQTNSDTQTQSVGIGAYVTIEAYHEDGTLFQKWEGHNDLSESFRNALVGCITGLDDTPWPIFGCNFNVDTLRIVSESELDDVATLDSRKEVATLTLKPEGCMVDSSGEWCTGWNMEAIFDYDDLDCTPTVDCLKIRVLNAFGKSGPNSIGINTISVNPMIPLSPNDKVVINMDFSIPK